MFQRMHGRSGLVVAVMAVTLVWGTAHADDVPWALRDHYTADYGTVSFKYARDNGEWTVLGENIGTIVNNVRTVVKLADGTTLDFMRYKDAKAEVGKFSSDLGSGRYVALTFPPRNNLALRHRIEIYQNRPFVMLNVEIANAGSKPLRIAEIKSVDVMAKGVNNIDSNGRMESKSMPAVHVYPVQDDEHPDSLVYFEIGSPKILLGIGVIPAGRARSSVAFNATKEAWIGGVTSRFEPAVDLQPGKRLAADAVWVSFAATTGRQMEEYYTWTRSALRNGALVPEAPRFWLTTPPGSSLDDLYAVVKEWGDSDVTHVLVPAAWEGQPGSMKGAQPRYPKDMSEVVKGLIKEKKVPGITVDPLLADENGNRWTVKGADGRYWINPLDKSGRAYAVKRLRAFVDWGFQFFTVTASQIPDAVLQKFGLTRTEADERAFAIMLEAADGWPVLPAARMRITPGSKEWREAVESSELNGKYGLFAGPVQVDLGNARSLDQTFSQNLRDYAGAVELVGKPTENAQKQLAQIVHDSEAATK